MSHNYTNYSTPKTNTEPTETPTVNQEVVTEKSTTNEIPVDDTLTTKVAEVAEVVPESEEAPTVIGTVVDCVRRSVRESASLNAEVSCEIPKYSDVLIDENESTDEFYKVCTESGAEGFCMKKFIALK